MKSILLEELLGHLLLHEDGGSEEGDSKDDSGDGAKHTISDSRLDDICEKIAHLINSDLQDVLRTRKGDDGKAKTIAPYVKAVSDAGELKNVAIASDEDIEAAKSSGMPFFIVIDFNGKRSESKKLSECLAHS